SPLSFILFFSPGPPPPPPTLFPYTTLFRSPANGTATLGARFKLWIAFCVMNAVIGRDYQGCYSAHIQGNSDISFGKHRQHIPGRSEEHTSELQSRFDLVCRLLLEKKKNFPA